MERSAKIFRVAAYSLPLQCAIFCVALVFYFSALRAAFGFSFRLSLLAGLIAFVCGIVAAISTRRARWLSLSAAAAFVAFFTLLIGLALGGHPGI